MRWRRCRKPHIIKNKFISTLIGTLGIHIGLGFLLPLRAFSVYITSYIHIKQNFVNMHYGYFMNLILTLSLTFSVSLGGIIEHKLGFTFTTILGSLIVFITNFFFFKIQNIWACYCLILFIGVGAGIAASLLNNNLILYYPKKKGILGSLFGTVMVLVSQVYTIIGEKIIAGGGQTLEKNEEVYKPAIAERTYLYLMIGFFTVPFGNIIFALFAYEYKKKIELNLIIPYEDIEINNNENKDDNKEKNEGNEQKEINADKEEKKEEDKEEKKEEDKEEKQEEQKEEKKEEQKEENNKAENEEKKEEIKEDKKEEQKKVENNQEEENNNDININFGNNDDETENKKKKVIKILKTFRFWRIAIAVFLSSFPTSFMMATGRTFGAIIGIKGGALQFLTVSQGVALILIGPIFGFLSDKKGPLIFLRLSSLIIVIPGITLFFFIDNTVLYMISFVFVALGFSAKMISFNPFLMEIYGIKESVILGGIINGIGRLGEAISAVSAFVISLYYEGDGIKSPYKIIFIVGSGLSLLSFIIFMFESKKKFEYEEETNSLDKLDKLIDNDNITEAK